jgi:hypothetical protein
MSGVDAASGTLDVSGMSGISGAFRESFIGALL